MLYALVLMPIMAAFASYALGKKDKIIRNRFAIVVSGTELALAFLTPMGKVSIPGICALGLGLEMDGFRKVYAVVIALMWFMTLCLSDEYFRSYHNRNRYYFFNLMTLGATMGVFLASDLYTAFIFFEVMSFTSYTWVIHEETPGAIRAANTYLAVAVIGGLAALMGLFIIQHELGTTEISKLYELSAQSANKPALYAAGGCILFGFGAKAGMFPLHIWLPKAHPVAPAPASALLSGVLTKSGVWGILAISCNLFRCDSAWGTLILILGTITMVLGAVLALFSIDLKRTLACSSMSQIGFILVGVGMMGLLGHENALAARGTLLHMMNHSLFKLTLFMCAGVVYMNTHTLNLNKLKGFGRGKKLLNLCFLLGAVGIGGIPLFSGYVSKTLLHESIVEGRTLYGGFGLAAVEWLFLISGGITLAYMTKLYVCLFVESGQGEKLGHGGKYMNALSASALLISALLIPALGVSANWSMNSIAELGTDFFHAATLEHAVKYLSLENLKGALISIAIGAALYFLVVRALMMREGEYLNLWPEKLDLEELLYRPLLLKWLPGILGYISAIFGENKILTPLLKWLMGIFGYIGAIFGENKIVTPLCRGAFRAFGVLSRAVCDLTDALVLLLRRTVFRESPVKADDKVVSSLPYRLGSVADTIAVREGREEPGEHRYAHLMYRMRRTVASTTRVITGNMSFALLMLVAAVCIVFVYIILIY